MDSLRALSFLGRFRTYVRTEPLDSKRTGASSGASTRGLWGVLEVDMRWRPMAAVRCAAAAEGRDIVLRRTLRAYIWNGERPAGDGWTQCGAEGAERQAEDGEACARPASGAQHGHPGDATRSATRRLRSCVPVRPRRAERLHEFRRHQLLISNSRARIFSEVAVAQSTTQSQPLPPAPSDT